MDSKWTLSDTKYPNFHLGCTPRFTDCLLAETATEGWGVHCWSLGLEAFPSWLESQGGSGTGFDGALRYACAVPLIFLTTGLLGWPRQQSLLLMVVDVERGKHEGINMIFLCIFTYVYHISSPGACSKVWTLVLPHAMPGPTGQLDPRFVLSFANELFYAGSVWLMVVLLHISGKPLDAKGASVPNCAASSFWHCQVQMEVIRFNYYKVIRFKALESKFVKQFWSIPDRYLKAGNAFFGRKDFAERREGKGVSYDSFWWVRLGSYIDIWGSSSVEPMCGENEGRCPFSEHIKTKQHMKVLFVNREYFHLLSRHVLSHTSCLHISLRCSYTRWTKFMLRTSYSMYWSRPTRRVPIHVIAVICTASIRSPHRG